MYFLFQCLYIDYFAIKLLQRYNMYHVYTVPNYLLISIYTTIYFYNYKFTCMTIILNFLVSCYTENIYKIRYSWYWFWVHLDQIYRQIYMIEMYIMHSACLFNYCELRFKLNVSFVYNMSIRPLYVFVSVSNAYLIIQMMVNNNPWIGHGVDRKPIYF